LFDADLDLEIRLRPFEEGIYGLVLLLLRSELLLVLGLFLLDQSQCVLQDLYFGLELALLFADVEAVLEDLEKRAFGDIVGLL
jgi:hypothetical protein